MKTAVVVAIAALALQGAFRDSQLLVTGTGSIAGIVAEDAGGRPLRRAIVALMEESARVGYTTITDDGGRFAFTGLPQGRFKLAATKAPYLTASFGAKRPGRGSTMAIPLSAGQAIENITLKMVRGAVLAGRITDENGQPVARGSVGAAQIRTSAGVREVSGATGYSATDERGNFRIFGLAPGDYVLSARASSHAMAALNYSLSSATILAELGIAPGSAVGLAFDPAALAYAQSYFPGTSSLANATAVTVGPADERLGIDFAIAPARLANIDGFVQSSDGRPLTFASVALLPEDDYGSPAKVANPGTGAGTFSFAGLLPGRYTVIGRGFPEPNGSPTVTRWASVSVMLDGRDLHDLPLSLQPGATIQGKVDFDASVAGAIPARSGIQVRLLAGGPIGRAFSTESRDVEAKEDGTFTITGVSPGRYRLKAIVTGASGSAAWTLKSSTIDGLDAVDSQVEIGLGDVTKQAVVTLTDRPTAISGTLRVDKGTPTSDYLVVVFSTNRAYWGADSRRVMGPVRASSDGHFSVVGLPAGEYFLAASADVEAADLLDDSFLANLATTAIRMSLADGEKKVQDFLLFRLAAGLSPSASPSF